MFCILFVQRVCAQSLSRKKKRITPPLGLNCLESPMKNFWFSLQPWVMHWGHTVTLVMVLDENENWSLQSSAGPQINHLFFQLYILGLYPLASYSVSGLSSTAAPRFFFKRMTNAMPNYGAQQGAERGLSDRCTGSQREVNQCLSKNGMVPANEISKYRQKIEK